MKIFLDFDDVLFNTRDFRRDMRGVFQKCGVDNVMYESTRDAEYSEASFEKGKCYDFERHIETLQTRYPQIHKEEIARQMDIFLEDADRYVFSDVLEFLSRFPKQSLFILSFGERIFQEKKIMRSGVGSCVGTVIITQGSKTEEMQKYISNKTEKVFFLDDRVQYMKEMKEVFPFVKTILVSRPEGRYHDARDKWCDFEVQNLEEARGAMIG